MLSTLFFFYIVFAIANYKPRFFLWLFLISLVCLFLSVTYIETNQRGDDLWFRLWLLYIFPPNKLVVILLGVGTARLFIKYINQLKGWTGKIRGTFLEITALLLAIDFIMWGKFAHFTKHILLFMNAPFPKSLELINSNYIAAPIVSLLVIAVFAVEKGIISQFLKIRPFLFLGEISFSIFISHQLLINYLFGYYKHFLLYTFGQLMTVLLLLAVIILLASLIYTFIEDPVRNRLRISTH
jgi:peptidoglycan/LPS O-acetylase OafA/YrhL